MIQVSLIKSGKLIEKKKINRKESILQEKAMKKSFMPVEFNELSYSDL